MGLGNPLHLLILAIVVILVLGGGRFSAMMGDVAGAPVPGERGIQATCGKVQHPRSQTVTT